jgi:hypothetical protein
MKGLTRTERKELFDKLTHGQKYGIHDLKDAALTLYPDRDQGILLSNLGTEMINDGHLIRVGRGEYIKSAENITYKRSHKVNGGTRRELPSIFSQIPEPSSPATALHLATDKELADELRRRGYEVEAKKITTI